MNTIEPLIGFSTGCLHKTGIDIFSPALLGEFRSLGCTAVELNALDEGHLDKLELLKPEDLEGFGYVSLHGPALGFTFRDDTATHEVLDRIAQLQSRLTFQSVVIHPDRVEQWGVLEKYLGRIPFSIENMDIRKPVARSVSDFEGFVVNPRYSVVIDVQHCLTNDPTYKLGASFLKAYSDRIAHVHLSGYDRTQNHWALFRTGQDELVRQAISVKRPIIIESVLHSLSELALEMEYIRKHSVFQ